MRPTWPRLTNTLPLLDPAIILLGLESGVLKPMAIRLATQTLIECPATRDLVPTGVAADTLLDIGRIYVLIGCRRCGADHGWLPEQAVVVALSMPML